VTFKHYSPKDVYALLRRYLDHGVKCQGLGQSYLRGRPRSFFLFKHLGGADSLAARHPDEFGHVNHGLTVSEGENQKFTLSMHAAMENGWVCLIDP
jgi:hypothetical protein